MCMTRFSPPSTCAQSRPRLRRSMPQNLLIRCCCLSSCVCSFKTIWVAKHASHAKKPSGRSKKVRSLDLRCTQVMCRQQEKGITTTTHHPHDDGASNMSNSPYPCAGLPAKTRPSRIRKCRVILSQRQHGTSSAFTSHTQRHRLRGHAPGRSANLSHS